MSCRALIIERESIKWRYSRVTGDGELCGGVAQGDEAVVSTAVVDDHLHFVGAQRDVVGVNDEGGGGSVGHLPEASFGGNQTVRRTLEAFRCAGAVS